MTSSSVLAAAGLTACIVQFVGLTCSLLFGTFTVPALWIGTAVMLTGNVTALILSRRNGEPEK